MALSLHPWSAACAYSNHPAVPPSHQVLPSDGSASGDANQEEAEVNSILYKDDKISSSSAQPIEMQHNELILFYIV